MNKRFSIFLVILLFLGLSSQAYSQLTWQIKEVLEIKLSNGNVIYRIATTTETKEGRGLPYDDFWPGDLKYLLDYFEVSNFKDLEGKEFESNERESGYALNFLVVNQKHGGKYIPPTDDELRSAIVKSFAKMECLDFSNYDQATTTHFAYREFTSSEKESWLTDLKQRVYEESNHTVVLSRLQNNSVPSQFIIKTAQKFFLLTKTENKKLLKVIIRFACFSDPFDCF